MRLFSDGGRFSLRSLFEPEPQSRRLRLCGEPAFFALGSLFIGLALLHGSFAAAAEPIGREFPPPDYLGMLTQYYALYTQTSPLSVLNQPKQEAATSPQLALLSLRLWQVTHNPDYLVRGRTIFANIISTNRNLDTFDTAPVLRCAMILRSAGDLDANQLAWLHQRFVAIQAKGYEFRHGNRELGRLWGPAIAAFTLFADDPAFAATRSQFLAWWPRLNAVGDLDENAGNYQAVGLAELIGIAQAIGCEQNLAASERWRNTFARLRDGVSPGGQMPEWNDDYFHEGGWPSYIYLFEYAAHLYNDGTFETAARKIFYRQEKAFALLKHTSQHWDLHELAAAGEAVDLVDLSPLESTAPEPLLCGVTHRYDELGEAVYDKLILRPSNEPGSPSIWIDAYADGDHSHTQKKGSIGYYEVDQVPLFRGGYGRHSAQQTGDGGNSFYLQRNGDTFPIDSWQTNQWKTVSLPTRPLPLPGKPADVSKRLFTQLQGWGLSGDVTDIAEGDTDQASPKESGTQLQGSLYMANLRLEGPAGTKLIDDFRSANGKKLTGGSLVMFDGKPCLKVTPENARFATRPYNLAFDPLQYKVLSYDILQTGSLPSVNFRMPPGPNGLHTYGGWNRVAPGPFFASLTSAKTDLVGHDCSATLVYEGYGTWDSKLTRQIVLTAEGALIVRDNFVPGPSAAGWTGGPVWQLATLAAHGPDWFASDPVQEVSCVPADSRVAERGMLVKFAMPGDLHCGFQTSSYGKGLKRYIAFGKLPLEEGKPVTTITVVLPTQKSADLALIAAAVRVVSSSSGARVFFRSSGAEMSSGIQVFLSDTGFTVTR